MSLPQVGDVDLEDAIYDALIPLDGWAKDARRSDPRPYWLTHEGKRYVVVMSGPYFGSVRVQSVMETNPDACERCYGFIEPGTTHSMFNGNQMFACQITTDRPPKMDAAVNDCQ